MKLAKMSCRACFVKLFKTEYLCTTCKTSLTKEQQQALCGAESKFKLVKIQDISSNCIKLSNAIPSKKKPLFFEVLCGDITEHLINSLDEFIGKDLISVVSSYLSALHRIRLDYTSSYDNYFGDWCYSHSLRWSEEARFVGLNYEHAVYGDFAYIFSKCGRHKLVTIRVDGSNWGPELNLVSLIPECSHSRFLKVVSWLIQCIPKPSWDYRPSFK